MGSLSTTTTTNALTAKTTPLQTLMHTPLTALETHLKSLLINLTTTPTYSAAPSITASLLRADDDLTTALQALYTHQQNHARIVTLRDEAKKLQDEIRGCVGRCVEVRGRIGRVLADGDDSDDSDDEGEEEEDDDDNEGKHEKRGEQTTATTAAAATIKTRKRRDVDYKTLLSFASKIGRHNYDAAKQVEAESTRRILASRQKQQQQQQQNPQDAPNPPKPSSLIPKPELDWLNSETDFHHARSTAAFPPADSLRRGALGRLQWAREQQQQQQQQTRSPSGGGGGGGGGGNGGGDTTAITANMVKNLLAELLEESEETNKEGRGEDPTTAGPALWNATTTTTTTTITGRVLGDGNDGTEQQSQQTSGGTGGEPGPGMRGLTSQQRSSQPYPQQHERQQQQESQQQQQQQERQPRPEPKQSTTTLDLDMWNEDDDDDDDEDD